MSDWISSGKYKIRKSSIDLIELEFRHGGGGHRIYVSAAGQRILLAETRLKKHTDQILKEVMN